MILIFQPRRSSSGRRNPARAPKWELNPEPDVEAAAVCRLVKSNLPFRCHLCVRSSPLYLLASGERLCSLSPPSTEISSLTQPPYLTSLSSASLPQPFPPCSHPARLKTNQSKPRRAAARRAGALGRAAIHQENNKIKITLLYLIWSFIFSEGRPRERSVVTARERTRRSGRGGEPAV